MEFGKVSDPLVTGWAISAPKFDEVENSEFSENSELKTLEFSPRHLDQTPSFLFWTILKTENSELKTSEFSVRHCDQTSKFSNSEFSILHYTQKLGVENLGVLSKVYPSNVFLKLNCVTRTRSK